MKLLTILSLIVSNIFMAFCIMVKGWGLEVESWGWIIFPLIWIYISNVCISVFTSEP